MVTSRSALFQKLSLFLFFLMMMFPNMYNTLKACILLLMILFTIGRRESCVNVLIKKIYLSYFIFGVYQIFIGLLFQNENPFDWFTVTILWPFIYLLFLPSYNSESKWSGVLHVLFWGHVFVVVYDLLFCFGVILGYEIPNIYESIMVGQTPFSFYEGLSSRLNFVNLNTITFSAPVLFVLWLANYDIGIKKIYLSIVILATFLLFIISGRRSVMGIFALCPIIILTFSNYFSKTDIKALKYTLTCFLIVLSIALVTFFIIDQDFFYGYVGTFTKAFDSDAEPVKFAQEKSLIEAFLNNPIFGYGAGARFFEPFPGRAVWSSQFELQYHLVLARTGIIGFFVWGCAIFGLIVCALKCVKTTKDIILISLLYGYGFMLLANATNPVFCCFDFMLSFFLVSARLNYLLHINSFHRFISVK